MTRRLCFFLLLFCSNIALAQTVIISGKVVDKKNNAALAAVFVSVGLVATSTNNKGDFSISADLSLLISKGLYFSCVGYQKQHLLYQPNHFYKVEMLEKVSALNEVVIGSGENIIRKAYKNIGKNYPDKPIILKGILRGQLTRHKSAFFKSDAIVNAYVPPYTGNEEASVAVVQNKIDSINDKTLRYLKWVSVYNLVASGDFVHKKGLVIQLSKMKRYQYSLVGKQTYQDHRVYVVNVSLKDTAKINNQIDVVLYIDTASYAFVAANVTQLNVVKLGFLKQSKSAYTVIYQPIGAKWYVKEIHAEGYTVYGDENPTETIDFITTGVDSTDVKQLAYKNIVQNLDDTQLIAKEGDKSKWLKYDSIFMAAEAENRITKLEPSLLDSMKKKNAMNSLTGVTKSKKSGLNGVLNYISHDNIRALYGAVKFPVYINSAGTQKLNVGNYGSDVSLNFRLANNLFFEFMQSSNISSGKRFDISDLQLNLANEIIFNKSFHQITLVPFLGYERLIIKNKFNQVDYNTLNLGMHAYYEINHQLAFYLSTGYSLENDGRQLQNFVIEPIHYSYIAGLILKI
jgi:hypothetical protein